MRQGPLTAIACRPSRLPFNGWTLQPGMFRSESAVAAWSASIALLQRLCRSGCTFRLLPVSKSSRNPACRKLTITVSTSVKQTRQSVNYRFTLRPALTRRDFIGTYRDELIRRCQAKVALRVPPDKAVSYHGVPLFLNQLREQLRDGAVESRGNYRQREETWPRPVEAGIQHRQVVHDYGDVCQSITELAVELGAPISTEDFRTLNRCLDNAIAGAVTEFTLEQGVTRDKDFAELENLTDAAILAYRVVRTGGVGVAGSTGAVVERSLYAIRAALNARSREPKQKETLTPTA